MPAHLAIPALRIDRYHGRMVAFIAFVHYPPPAGDESRYVIAFYLHPQYGSSADAHRHVTELLREGEAFELYDAIGHDWPLHPDTVQALLVMEVREPGRIPIW